MPPFRLRTAGISLCSLVLAAFAPALPAAQTSTCGNVTEYVAATASSPGQLTIAGRMFPIAAGTRLTNDDLIIVDADLCLNGTTDDGGQLIEPSTISPNRTGMLVACGLVMQYRPATDTTTGVIAIGDRSFVIGEGASITDGDLITPGADLCLEATTNGLNQIVNPSFVRANLPTVSLCGTVSEYTEATADTRGSLTIAGRAFPIAAGTTVANADLIAFGASLCLSGTINGSGELVAPSSVSPNRREIVQLCGTVTRYAAATATEEGILVIADRTFPIASGTIITNGELIAIGANICLDAIVNGLGRMIDPSSVRRNTPPPNPTPTPFSVRICGTVSRYIASSATSFGSLTIAGRTFPVAPDATVTSTVVISAGADLCLSGTLNSLGELVSPSTVTGNRIEIARLCGTVTRYTAASANAEGLLEIGRKTFPIAPGAFVMDSDLITSGANLCLDARTNGLGQIIDPSSVRPNTLTAVNICGTVSGYMASSSTSAGSLAIAGRVFPISPGTILADASLIAAGANLCLTGMLDVFGELVAPSGVSLAPRPGLAVCGVVDAWSPATGSERGSIRIDGESYPIAIGTVITNGELISVGLNLCLLATLGPSGEIVTPSTVTARVVANVKVCGFVTAYSPAKGSDSGSLTIAGMTYTIAPRTVIDNSHLIEAGAELCLAGSLSSLGQIIAPSSVELVAVSTLQICGTVTQYAQATAVSSGSITIAGRTIRIAPGTVIGNDLMIEINAGFCLEASLNAGGQIVSSGSLHREPITTFTICGVVSRFNPATSTMPGSVTIAGRILPIAPGSNVLRDDLLYPGGIICLDLTLNGAGQVVAPSEAMEAAQSSIHICGVVSAFDAATPVVQGSITIAGQLVPIGAGTTLTNQALVETGAELCLDGTLAPTGQLIVPSEVSENFSEPIEFCGIVTAYTAPTSTAEGSLSMGGRVIAVAAGTFLEGAELIFPGQSLCLSGRINPAGKLITPSRVIADVTTNVTVCGRVDAYAEATASVNGSLTIGGRTFVILAGTTISNSGFIRVATSLCLSATVSAAGVIISPSSVTANANGFVHLCGVVTDYTPSTATEEGSIRIEGRRFPIAAGTSLGTVRVIRIGATVCLDAALGNRGEIVPPSSVNAFARMSIGVCGVVNAYSAATAGSAGSITIGRETIRIARDTTIIGSELIRIGANLCLSATLDPSGQIVAPGSVILNVPVKIEVCGLVAAFTPAGSSTAGTITLAGRIYAIAPSTTLQNQSLILTGSNICLFANTGPDGAIVSPSAVSIEPVMRISICGEITDFRAATSDAAGGFTIAGTTFTIAPGTIVPMTNVMIGTRVCIDLSVTPRGETVQPILITLIPGVPSGPRPAPATPARPVAGPGPTPGGSGTGPYCTNHEPILSVPSQQIAELGETLRFRVAAADPDGDGVALAVASLPTSASFDGDTGEFTFTPVDLCDAEDRSYVVTFIGFDANGGSTSGAVRIDVVRAAEGEPAPPSVSIPHDHVIARVGEKLSFAAVARGAAAGCGAEIEAADITNGSYDVSTETYSITPSRAQATGVPLVVRFTATDCNGRTSTRAATVIVIDESAGNSQGRLAMPIRGVVPGVTSSAANVCGAVSAFTAATASTAGRITISSSGQVDTFPIHAGVSITSGHLLRDGAQLCLVATLASGSVVAPSAVAQDISLVSGGSEAGWVDVPVSNTGSAALTLTSIALAGGTAFRIEGADALPSILRPGDRIVVRIRFLPAAAGLFTDTLTINSDDAASPVYVVTLVGEAR